MYCGGWKFMCFGFEPVPLLNSNDIYFWLHFKDTYERLDLPNFHTISYKKVQVFDNLLKLRHFNAITVVSSVRFQLKVNF